MPEAKTVPTEEEKVDDLVTSTNEVKAPKVREQHLKYLDFEKTYKQSKLSFFGKLELSRIVGKALGQAAEGGLGLRELAQDANLNNVDGIMKVFASVAEHVPDLWLNIYMLALGVTDIEKPLVKEILTQSHDEETGEGGLSDEDGIAIMETFIDQNGKALRDFFRDALPKLWTRFQKELEISTSNTEPSKSSKPSRRLTGAQ